MGYTKGPWVATLGMSGLIRGIRGDGGKNVVNFNGISAPASEEGQDNARLIASAPELLEALDSLLSAIEDWHGSQRGEYCDEMCDRLHKAMDKADAALSSVGK